MILDNAMIFWNALFLNLVAMVIDTIVVIVLGAYAISLLREESFEFCNKNLDAFLSANGVE